MHVLFIVQKNVICWVTSFNGICMYGCLVPPRPNSKTLANIVTIVKYNGLAEIWWLK